MVGGPASSALLCKQQHAARSSLYPVLHCVALRAADGVHTTQQHQLFTTCVQRTTPPQNHHVPCSHRAAPAPYRCAAGLNLLLPHLLGVCSMHVPVCSLTSWGCAACTSLFVPSPLGGVQQARPCLFPHLLGVCSRHMLQVAADGWEGWRTLFKPPLLCTAAAAVPLKTAIVAAAAAATAVLAGHAAAWTCRVNGQPDGHPLAGPAGHMARGAHACTCLLIYACECACSCTCVSACACEHACLCTCVFTCVCAHACVSDCACVSACAQVLAYVVWCVCVCV